MKALLRVVGISLVILLMASGADARKQKEPSRSARRHLKVAIESYHRADFETAMLRFTKALARYPGWKTATAYRAMCRWSMGDKAGAADDAAVAVGLRPNSAESFVGRGMGWLIKKDMDRAEADFEQALQLDPELPVAHYALGTVRSLRRDFDGALKQLDNAVRLKPDFAVALFLRANVKDRMKDFEGAVKDYARVLEINPKFFTVFYWRAKTYRNLKDYPKSLSDLDGFLETAPDYVEALYLRSNLRYMTRDFEGSVADLDRVIELDPKRGLAYSNRGQARFQLGDRDGALADLRKALELTPSRRDRIMEAISFMETAVPEPAVPNDKDEDVAVVPEESEPRKGPKARRIGGGRTQGADRQRRPPKPADDGFGYQPEVEPAAVEDDGQDEVIFIQ